MNSPEWLSLKENFPLLVESVKDEVESLAANLCASKLISEEQFRDVYNFTAPKMDSANKLISAVMARVKVDPQRFHDFTKILQYGPYYKDILEVLHKTYQSRVTEKPPHTSAVSLHRTDILTGTWICSNLLEKSKWLFQLRLQFFYHNSSLIPHVF